MPAYLHEAGLRDFADIQRFATELNHEIYGIEPGNDGNRLVLEMIKENQLGLGDFKLVESSEQGMLAQVERAVAAKRPIVFFGWEPHPMNTRFDMRYLTGGDASFGPNYGGATVYTNVRAGYLARMPERRAPAQEPQVHAARRERDHGRHPRPQARARSRGRRVAEGESRRAGRLVRRRHDVRRQAGAAVVDAPSADAGDARARGFEAWITAHKIPLGPAVESGIDFIKANGRAFFAGVSTVIQGSVDGVNAALAAIPGSC